MSDDTLEIFIAAYDTEDGAAKALKEFKAAQYEGAIHLIDGAVIVHKADGKVHYDETADPSTRRWTKRGAIAGGVVGLIFPPSIIASAIVGAGAGGIWGKVRDKGFQDSQLKEIGESIPPGSSAFIAVAEDRVVQQLESGLHGYERIARQAVSADAAAMVIAEAPKEEAETPA
jgi:uncharacterized membrane protein